MTAGKHRVLKGEAGPMMEALNATLDGVTAKTALHVCFGNAHNIADGLADVMAYLQGDGDGERDRRQDRAHRPVSHQQSNGSTNCRDQNTFGQ